MIASTSSSPAYGPGLPAIPSAAPGDVAGQSFDDLVDQQGGFEKDRALVEETDREKARASSPAPLDGLPALFPFFAFSEYPRPIPGLNFSVAANGLPTIEGNGETASLADVAAESVGPTGLATIPASSILAAGSSPRLTQPVVQSPPLASPSQSASIAPLQELASTLQELVAPPETADELTKPTVAGAESQTSANNRKTTPVNPAALAETPLSKDVRQLESPHPMQALATAEVYGRQSLSSEAGVTERMGKNEIRALPDQVNISEVAATDGDSRQPHSFSEIDLPKVEQEPVAEVIPKTLHTVTRGGELLVSTTPASVRLSDEAVASRSDAARLIEKVWQATDQLSTSHRGRMDLEIPLQGSESVRVSVELRSGEIHATIRSDSPELREALEKLWPDFSIKTIERGFKLADANFSPIRQESGGWESGQNPRREASSEGGSPQQRRSAPSSQQAHSPQPPAPIHSRSEIAARPRSMTLWA